LSQNPLKKSAAKLTCLKILKHKQKIAAKRRTICETKKVRGEREICKLYRSLDLNCTLFLLKRLGLHLVLQARNFWKQLQAHFFEAQWLGIDAVF